MVPFGSEQKITTRLFILALVVFDMSQFKNDDIENLDQGFEVQHLQ